MDRKLFLVGSNRVRRNSTTMYTYRPLRKNYRKRDISSFTRQLHETGYLVLYEKITGNGISRPLWDNYRKRDISSFMRQVREKLFFISYEKSIRNVIYGIFRVRYTKTRYSQKDSRKNWRSKHNHTPVRQYKLVICLYTAFKVFTNTGTIGIIGTELWRNERARTFIPCRSFLSSFYLILPCCLYVGSTHLLSKMNI
jgi:hypothetical protein